MKKYLALFVIFLMVFVLGNKIARAEDGNSASSGDSKIETSGEDNNGINDSKDQDVKIKRDAIKQEFGAKREEIKNQIEATREEAKTKMEALRENIKNEKDSVKAKIKENRIVGREKAMERFDGAVARVNSLKERINTQIAKFETKGLDVTEAKATVATVDTNLDNAKTKIAEINTILAASVDQLSPENKTKISTLTQEIQALLVESQKSLKSAVKSLRDSMKSVLGDIKNADNTKSENNQ